MKKILLLSILCIFILSSCAKYREFEDLEIIENSYSGEISTNSPVGDLDLNIKGNIDSGTYSFVWDNRGKEVVLSTENSNSSGKVQFVIKDARANEVLNETWIVNEGPKAFASQKGKTGKWEVTITLTDFNGDEDFDLNP